MRGKITVTLKAVEIYLAFRPPPPPSIHNTFPRACDISREGGSKWLERGSKVGYVKKGRRVRAIYDIYLWTRLRDRNPEVVKVGFVTYFPSPPDVEIPIDWRTGVSQFPSRSPDWRGWKQRFTSGKGQNRSRWICIYVWYIAKGGEDASWACSERFSLAFHGMRSCFKILVNLASLSLYICIYIYIRILHTYIDLPIFRAACLFANANLEEIDFFPPSLSFLSLSFSWLLSFLLITQFIFILRKIYDNWRFPLSPVHGGISDFLIFSFFLSFFFAVYRRRRWFPHRWRKNVFTGTNPRAFIWQTGIPSKVYSAVLRLPSVDVAFVAVQRDPPSARWTSPRKNKGKLPSDAILDILFLGVYAFLLIVFYWSREIVHRGKTGKINLGIIIDRSKFDRNNL